MMEIRVGQSVRISRWVGNPKWLATSEGRVVEVTKDTVTIRDTHRTMGRYATTMIGRSAIEKVEPA